MFNAGFAQSLSIRALEDARFLERCRRGDEVALAALVDRHRNRLIRVASNILRDVNEAEDVAQEAFLKAFRELGNLRDDRAFAGYIYRICVRLCMDKLRQRRAEPAEFDFVDNANGSLVENKIVVEKLLNQLTEDLRTTLVLREMEQLSYEEIAEYMGVPVGTVRSRLHVARERFRKLWLIANKETPL
ncbi:MAG: sigma-70 family RNA polymerase sigma factor [Armatimonadetes bacterium]|nr:sigma-70 family RNA polymerase sigma factor [Armatimonadota bacterium]